MGLSIYITQYDKRKTRCTCECCGNAHRGHKKLQVAHLHLTHNLNKMAELSYLYKPIWRPDENGITFASQMIQYLEAGIDKLEKNPDFYIKIQPSNGFGSYHSFLKVCREYLDICKEYPDAIIDVCR
jgi:hypothetical protein